MDVIESHNPDMNEGHVGEVIPPVEPTAHMEGTAPAAPKTKESVEDEKLPPSVYIIVLALVIDLIGFTIILPLLPSLLEYYRLNGKHDLYHSLEIQINNFRMYAGIPKNFNAVLFGGFLGSLFSLMQFLFSPVIGALSDVYGRKPLLLITMTGVALSHFMWAISTYFYIFIIARIIAGVSRASINLGTAIVTDLCSVRSRSKGMALIGIAFSIGFITGPIIGAVLIRKNVNNIFPFWPPLVALSLSVVNVLFLQFYFKESLPHEKRAPAVNAKYALSFINPSTLISFKNVKDKNAKDLAILQHIGWIYFLFIFIYSGLEFTLTFLVHERFHFTSMDQGYMFFASGLTMALIQGTYVRKIKNGNELKVALYGVIACIPGFIIIGLSGNLKIFYLGLAFYAFSSATVISCFSIFVSKLGSDDEKGAIVGTWRSLGYLARGMGPFVSALGYWYLGAHLCYGLGSVFLLLPLLLLIKLSNYQPEKTE